MGNGWVSADLETYTEWTDHLLHNSWWDDIEILALEHRLADPKRSIGGSFDGLIRKDGKTCLFDLKTKVAENSKRERPAQLGAYSELLQACTIGIMSLMRLGSSGATQAAVTLNSWTCSSAGIAGKVPGSSTRHDRNFFKDPPFGGYRSPIRNANMNTSRGVAAPIAQTPSNHDPSSIYHQL